MNKITNNPNDRKALLRCLAKDTSFIILPSIFVFFITGDENLTALIGILFLLIRSLYHRLAKRK